MQRIIILITLLFLSSTAAVKAADDVTYVGNLTGIDCTDCKNTIAKSLAKLRGVKTIRIKKKSDTVHQLTVETNGSSAISQSQATKALGKDSHYKITSWTQSTSR
tara:strand:+ start:680 stop:994 length:315 start_codon:yes stop_codon:yes gene_type:complete